MILMTALHVIFNHLEGRRKNYQLYKWWVRWTFEMPINDERDWRVAGLSRTENRRFWLRENRFNYYFYKIMNISMFVFNFFFTGTLFVVHFEIDIYTYIFVQAINSVHHIYFMHCFLSQVYIVSLMVLNLMRFFIKRFLCLKRKVERLNKVRVVNNRRLTRIIREHNRVHFELIKMNEFFRSSLGVKFVCFCAIGALCASCMIHYSIDWKIKAYVYSVILGMYITVIAIPFRFGNYVTTAVSFFRTGLDTI